MAKNTTYKTDITKAIKDINPDALFSILDDDYEKITWFEDTTVISESDIKARQELMDTRDAHIIPREKEFLYNVKIEKQLDNLWHDIDNGTVDKTGTFYTSIKAIKDANPKQS